MFSDPSSVYYSRPDIEYQQLRDNNRKECEVGANLDLPTNLLQYPVARSTGNGWVILTGQLTVNANINQGETLLTLPNEYLPLFESSFILLGFNPGGNTNIYRGVAVQEDGKIVYQSSNLLVSTEIIYFNSIMFLQKFTP